MVPQGWLRRAGSGDIRQPRGAECTESTGVIAKAQERPEDAREPPPRSDRDDARARRSSPAITGTAAPSGPIRLLARGARRSLARGPMTQQSRAQSMPRSRFE